MPARVMRAGTLCRSARRRTVCPSWRAKDALFASVELCPSAVPTTPRQAAVRAQLCAHPLRTSACRPRLNPGLLVVSSVIGRPSASTRSPCRSELKSHQASPGRYETLEATTGLRTVEVAIEHESDIVLMDVQLPDIDGVEALGHLRADRCTASIPVLALTAQAMHGGRERFLAAGFDRYNAKPVEHPCAGPHHPRVLRLTRRPVLDLRHSRASQVSPRLCTELCTDLTALSWIQEYRSGSENRTPVAN